MTRKLTFLVTAGNALRTYWASAVVIAGAGIVALTAVVPVVRLARSVADPGSQLRLSTIRSSLLGFHWGSNAATPGDAQAETVGLLFHLLLVAALATLILAALSILSISAARASSRFPEIAVRRAVGASRRNLVAAALTEGGTIGMGTLVVGLLAGSVVLVAGIAEWPGKIETGWGGPGVLAVIAVPGMIVLGSLFPLLATPSRRIVEPNPQPLELYIPALQLGMGLTVLVASAMLVRHAKGLVSVRDGRTGGGTVIELASADSLSRERAAQYQALLAKLGDEPGVQSASLMSPGTLVGLGITDAITTDCGYCPDGGVIIKWHVVHATHHFVSADTFGALRIERAEGRLLTDEDRWEAPPVAVISRTMARRHFQDGEAIGRQILLNLDQPEWYTVVGVVEDREPEGLGGAVQSRSAIYLSAFQHPPTDLDLLIRPASTGISLPRVEQVLGNFGVRSLAAPSEELAVLGREARRLIWFGRWFSILGWAMLLVTTVSTLVLMRHWVRSLRHELGLRRAVGARRIHLLSYVLVRALLTALAAVAVALWFGPALWDSLPEMVAGMSEWNLGLVLPLALILLAIAVAGAMFPAFQASRDTPGSLIASVGE